MKKQEQTGDRNRAFEFPIEWWFYLLFGAVGAALVWLYTSKYGIGLYPDSIYYISAARNLAEGKGLLCHTGSPLVLWPPLYAGVLALLSLASIPLLPGVRVLHALLLAVILFCSGEIIRRHCRSRWLLLLALFVSSGAIPLLSASIWLLSESLFIVLVLLTILLIPSCFRRRSMWLLLAVSLLTALTCLQRYIGVMLAFAISAIIIAYWPNSSLRKRMALSAGFFVVSCFPLGLYLARNYILTSTLTGFRISSQYTCYQNLNDMLNVISIWFFPVEIPSWVRKILLMLFGGAAGFHVLRSIWKDRESPVRDVQVPVIVLFTCVYIVAVVALATMVCFDRIADRILSPIYPFVVFLFIKSVDDLFNYYRNRGRRTIISILLVSLSLYWIGYTAYRVHDKAIYHCTYGAGGYSHKTWRESELLRVIRQEPIEGKIFSNAADVLYIFADQSAVMSPFRAETIEEFKAKMSTDGSNYLVWFNAGRKDYIYNLDEIRDIFVLETIRQCQDGAIYRIMD
ncbi:MAG TPA: hypothetical protein PLQ35_12345 [bacterium]|nr:hypothetical protein [bacterium]HQL63076.1 hypothetical protein [bacterium]